MQRKSGENLCEGLDRRPGQEAWTGGHCEEDTVRPLWDHCGGHCEETTVTGGLHRKPGQEAVDSLEPRFASKRQIGQIELESRLASKKQVDAETASSRDAVSEMQLQGPDCEA